jgi:membrane fusion protein (multidrug efflux system)
MTYKGKKNMLQNRPFLIFLAIIIPMFFIIMVGGCKSEKKTSSPGPGGGKLSVTAVVIRPQSLENKIVTTGTLLANEEVELRSEISGRVTGVFFEEGKKVKKGDLLLKINDRELKAQLAAKEVQVKQASDEEQRKLQLFKIKVVSQEEYDKALNSLKITQAEKESIEAQLAKTEIVAPFNGVIGLRYVSVGGYVSSSNLISTMQEIDPIKAEFSVPEKYAGKIKTGTEIVVNAGDSSEEYKGTVYAVESKIDPNTRTIKARARIPNPGGVLIPGAFAKVQITLEELPNAMVIPSEAIVPEITGEKVYLCANGRAKSTPIATGIRTERGVEVTRGLTPGDTLITSGLLQLAEGRAVQIKDLKDN